MRKFQVTNIEWDTDGETGVSLPNVLEVFIEGTENDGNDVADMIGDTISNMTGYCHLGFTFIEIF